MSKKNIPLFLVVLTIFIIFFTAGECFADMAVDTLLANYPDNKEIKRQTHFLNVHGFCALSINGFNQGVILL